MPISTAHVKKYIRQNFRRIHTIGDIARIFKISGETLRHSFRRTEGMPLSGYIIKIKVARVQQQLRQNSKPCFEILFDAGFLREDSGARRFRQMTGMTMLNYRNLHNKQNGRRIR